jgi:HD-like signal output (HDOD) protein
MNIVTPSVQSKDHHSPIPMAEQTLTRGDAEKLLASITLPPRPTVVTEVMREHQKDAPDLRQVAHLIGSDPALAAALMKTVNSPFYGLRGRITSIEHAVSLLGMTNISTLVLGLSLRKAMPQGRLQHFREEAPIIALVMSRLARALGGAKPDDAHLFGLFHDCGMPLLEQRYKNYPETVTAAFMSVEAGFTQVEERAHGTNHAVVGSLLASNWNLPDHIRLAILWHHDATVFSTDLPSDSLHLIALGRIAEFMVQEQHNLAMDCVWESNGRSSLDYLMLDKNAFEELHADIREDLQQMSY